MPKHELRHEVPAVQMSGVGGSAQKISRLASDWPFTSRDVSPLAWWRTLPSGFFRDAELLLVIDTLATVSVIERREEFAAARRGDAAAAIGVALSLLPILEVTVAVAIAMKALLRCALGGDATAALVLANLLHRVELGHDLATELSASWYAHHLHCTKDQRRFTSEEQAALSAIHQQDAVSITDRYTLGGDDSEGDA
ncbi:hypothetical protein [Bradyrhizobium cytisi]|uniref:hypothetical protein n=1 Tax=Bradyrhizobium cytisi TaxID=515489 RepID=UPI001653098E|nr:hypothetical protein [Bradyrhizobium cytisi]